MAYDLLIKNGTVVDGTGAARVRADIAIAGDRIAEIGKINEGANRVIDASDLIVVAGFHRSAHPLRRADLLGPAD